MNNFVWKNFSVAFFAFLIISLVFFKAYSQTLDISEIQGIPGVQGVELQNLPSKDLGPISPEKIKSLSPEEIKKGLEILKGKKEKKIFEKKPKRKEKR